MGLKIATAIGSDSDASVLGNKLAKEASAGLGGQEAGFVMVLSSIKYDHKALVQAIRSELKGVPLIGCTTAGEFTEKAVVKDSVAVVLFSKCNEYAFNVGHWHVLATLSAIIILFLAMDYFEIKKGKLRDSMAWLLTIGSIIAFAFATLYMLPLREGLEGTIFVIIYIGVMIMFLGITLFVLRRLADIFFKPSHT